MGFKGLWHQKHRTLLISQGREKRKSQNQGALPFPVWLGFVCLSHGLFLADMGVCRVSSFDWHLQFLTKEVKEPLAFQELFSSGFAEWSTKHISLSGTTGESRKPWRGSRIMMSELEDLGEGRGRVKWFRAWIWESE